MAKMEVLQVLTLFHIELIYRENLTLLVQNNSCKDSVQLVLRLQTQS